MGRGAPEARAQVHRSDGDRGRIRPYALNQTIQKVAVELATHSPAYDVVFIESDAASRCGGGRLLEPLDAYLDRNDLHAGDIDLGDLLPATLKSFRDDSKPYGFPYFAATQILYFRPDRLASAGFEGPPKTFADFVAMCAKLQSPDHPCTAMRGKPGASENVWYWSQILYGYGGRFFKDFPKELTPTINTPQAVTALDYYKKLMTKYGIPGSVSASYDEVVVAMQQGTIDTSP